MISHLSTDDSMIPTEGRLGGGLAGALVLHALVAGMVIAWAYVSHAGQNWGASNATAGAIQATMVSSIPLPPKQPTDQQNVLASENPSPAPEPPKPKTVEAPKPEAIPIPIKPTKAPTPPKVADRTTPTAPQHVQPAPPTTKATTGEAAGLRIAMNSVQTRAGTSSVGVPDQAFGSRFAYYVQQITQKVASQWYTGMLDANASGHRVYITFEIERDGTPANVRIAQASGDATLDQTALSAVRHIDSFPPLPEGYAGSRINVTYYFDPPAHP